ncbi:MAG TPA: hypothetical protein VIB08_11600 [Thermoanaerobaculia bacterium]
MRFLTRAVWLLALAAQAAPARPETPAPPAITASFSGRETVETATARASGRQIRVEVDDASGKRIAKADAPSPGGRPDVALSAGELGSAGALLEVSASGGGRICRSVWRLRDRTLTRLPVRDGGAALPDCETSGEWSARWEKTEGKPAVYVRERERFVAQGTLVEVRAFAFAGFALEPDAAASGARINGVAIPSWYPGTLYRKSDLEALNQRFGLDALRRSGRVSFETNRETGVFAVRLTGGDGEARLPVTGSTPVEGESPGVELSAGDPAVRVRVSLAGGRIPWEAVIAGAGPRDGAYASAFHRAFDRFQIYPDAEHELAAEALPGVWSSAAGSRMAIAAITGEAAVRLDGAELALSLDLAPKGSDLLLVPRDGSPPRWALLLRGPNALSRIPVRCENGVDCRLDGAGEPWRRAGSQMNVR